MSSLFKTGLRTGIVFLITLLSLLNLGMSFLQAIMYAFLTTSLSLTGYYAVIMVQFMLFVLVMGQIINTLEIAEYVMNYLKNQ